MADIKQTPASPPIDDSDSLESRIVEMVISGQLIPATHLAIESGIARGLPITFKRDDTVIKRYADGREEVLAVIDRSAFTIPPDVIIIGRK